MLHTEKGSMQGMQFMYEARNMLMGRLSLLERLGILYIDPSPDNRIFNVMKLFH